VRERVFTMWLQRMHRSGPMLLHKIKVFELKKKLKCFDCTLKK
jgi:hypothetical protein